MARLKTHINPETNAVEVNISIDSGKSSTKASAIDIHGNTVTDIILTTARQDDVRDGANILHFDNNRYVVGFEATTISNNAVNQSKVSNTHKIAVLTAIARMLKKGELDYVDVVKLAINSTLNDFINTNEREKMQQFYSGHIQMTYNGIHHHFTIETTVYSEGAGIAMKYEDYFGQEETAVIDIGSLNTTTVVYDLDSEPKAGYYHQSPSSISSFLQKVKRELSFQNLDNAYTLPQIQDIIIRKRSVKDKKVLDICDAMANEWLLNYKNELFRYDINLENYKLIFAGGGSMLLKPYIVELFKNNAIIDDNGAFANSVGALHHLLEEAS